MKRKLDKWNKISLSKTFNRFSASLLERALSEERKSCSNFHGIKWKKGVYDHGKPS